MYAGGFFTQAGGQPASCVARWDGTAWHAIGTGLSSYVMALQPIGSHTICAGGTFGGAYDGSWISNAFGIYDPATVTATILPTTPTAAPQLYPNPAHTSTTLLLSVAEARQAGTAVLLDALGRPARRYALPAGPLRH
jgi:hypothetical protein